MDLSTTFTGVRFRNPFLLSSAPPTESESNILRAFEVARQRGVKTVALLGKDGGKTKGKTDFAIIVGSTDTARIQEAHTVILHALLEVVESEFPA